MPRVAKVILFGAAILGAWMGASVGANAQEPIIYPSQGQSQEQLEQDRFQCYGWAKDQSGFDPMAPPTTATAPPQPGEKKGGTVEGAVGGAALGGIIGGIAGGSWSGAGRGALAGGAAGGILGTVRRDKQLEQEQRQRKQWEQQEGARYTQARSTYNRAFSACMEGRGYTVN